MNKNKNFVPLLVELKETLGRVSSKKVKAAMLLLIYCNEKRNGGRIPRALVEDRMELGTIILAGLHGELVDDCELFHWEGDTLVVDCYSVAHEEKAARNAERMAELSEARWKRRKTNRKASAKRGTEYGTHSDTHSDAEYGTECRQDKTRRQSSFSSKKKKTDSTNDTDTSLSLSGRPDSDGQAVVNQVEKEPEQETPMTDAELRAGYAEILKELER